MKQTLKIILHSLDTYIVFRFFDDTKPTEEENVRTLVLSGAVT